MGQIKVVNPFSRRAKLLVNGQRVIRLKPGESHLVNRVIPGHHTLQLRRRGRILATKRLHIERGEVARWTPEVFRRGDLRVSNTGRRSVRISGIGIASRWVGAGETVMIPQLREGDYRVKVTNYRGQTRSQRVRIFAHEESDIRIGGRRARVSTRSPYDWAVARR